MTGTKTGSAFWEHQQQIHHLTQNPFNICKQDDYYEFRKRISEKFDVAFHEVPEKRELSEQKYLTNICSDENFVLPELTEKVHKIVWQTGDGEVKLRFASESVKDRLAGFVPVHSSAFRRCQTAWRRNYELNSYINLIIKLTIWWSYRF